MGYHDLPTMRADPGLDPLRDRQDFRLLLAEVAFPADPFAVSGVDSRCAAPSAALRAISPLGSHRGEGGSDLRTSATHHSH